MKRTMHFQFFLSCIGSWLSDLALMARRNFQFFLSCIARSACTFTTTTTSAPFNSFWVASQSKGEARHNNIYIFQFFLSCIIRKTTYPMPKYGNYYLSILSELHQRKPEDDLAWFFQALSILSELHQDKTRLNHTLQCAFCLSILSELHPGRSWLHAMRSSLSILSELHQLASLRAALRVDSFNSFWVASLQAGWRASDELTVDFQFFLSCINSC